LDQIYAVTGHWGLGSANGNSVYGLIVYDLKTMEWKIVSGDHGLPIYNEYHQLSFDPDNGRIFIKGDNFIASIDLDQIDENNTGKEVEKLYFQERDPFGPMTYLGFQWGIAETSITGSSFLLVLGGILVLIFEPVKFKLFTLVPVRLFSKLADEDILSNRIRQEVLITIKKQPGIHYAELKRYLGLTNGTLSHHLRILEKRSLIKSMNIGIYKLFFEVSFNVPDGYRKLTKLQRRIVSTINLQPGITQKLLSTKLDKDIAVISYNLKKIKEMDLLNPVKEGSSYHYYLPNHDDFNRLPPKES
jgi:predicted transcriptional regulator